MRIETVGILGGSGFVGSHLAALLEQRGYQVRVLTRRRAHAVHLTLLPRVEVVECDVHDRASLQQALLGCDAVINLVGILHESRTMSFERAHVELPRSVATVCRELGVPRLLHMSALQAGPQAPSAYLRSKAAGEAALLEAAGSSVQTTRFRPSVIFGRGDSFLNLFAGLVRSLPVLLLAKPEARFQPVFVGDVARAFASSLENPDTYGQAYSLCGPQVYSLRQLVNYVMQVLGLRRPVIGLNDRLSYLQAYAMELLPVKLMTRDNLLSMQVDSVCECAFPPVFGFAPTALETVAPAYLADEEPRTHYLRFRGRAGR
jgi:NADH dehydrogenase